MVCSGWIRCVPFPPMKTCAALLLLIAATCFAQTRPAASGDDTQQLLQALADAPGPSGFEEPVRKIMVERMKPLSEKLSYDGLGSVIAVQGTSGPRIYGGCAHGRAGRRCSACDQ